MTKRYPCIYFDRESDIHNPGWVLAYLSEDGHVQTAQLSVRHPRSWNKARLEASRILGREAADRLYTDRSHL